MRSMKINRGWHFGLGMMDLGKRMRGEYGDCIVNLPHDYMIAGDVYADAPSGRPADITTRVWLIMSGRSIFPQTGKGSVSSSGWTGP